MPKHMRSAHARRRAGAGSGWNANARCACGVIGVSPAAVGADSRRPGRTEPGAASRPGAPALRGTAATPRPCWRRISAELPSRTVGAEVPPTRTGPALDAGGAPALRFRTARRARAATIRDRPFPSHPVPAQDFDAFLSLHRAGRFDEAERGYRACLREGDARAGAALGALLLQRERYADAVAVLEPVSRASPSDAGVATNLSVAYRRSGDGARAITEARRAADLAPGRASAWNALGLAALELGHVAEALDAFDAGLRIAPRQPALLLHRAHALRRLGRNADALPLYAALVAHDAAALDAWRGLAATQAALGQVEEALASRTRARSLASDDREVALEHAVALMQAGRVAEAAAALLALVAAGADDAQAWAWLGRARLRLGEAASAREAFDRAHGLDPGDAVVAHFLASLGGDLPARVEDGYIQQLFDDFADRFELTLVDRLGYSVPARLAALLSAQGADAARSMLDLGCGTGLMAVELARDARVIDGVDLSPRMLERARAKGLYRELVAAEIGAFLADARGRSWELIVAADVFVYVAALAPMFAAVRERLAPGGWFAFSLESSAGAEVELPPATGRYRHAPELAARTLERAGFVDVVREPLVIRHEVGEPVAGEVLVARAPGREG
ncbi:MAG: tetratricopeptide repeat protein [Lysobacteraceae bacterium]|nr:MAG: tetratricopeptide repeat protein [Xanthomonadaceae bacterium]